jgi:primosomal protein N' (replication factor Y) (superfamily II helicase)
MKQHQEFTSNSLVSKELLKCIESAIKNKEQALVYLNRRGTARAIVCAACGWQAERPHCNVSLTYHHDYHKLTCHTCGYKKTVPSACPDCGSADILFKSAGTKALASWLQKQFPNANVARFDTDNTKSESLAEGAVDILVGTQMLVKGLDLPKLSVVGIVAADLSLQIPDFSAEERTYQLINQAIGRVGRGHRSGTVILQTFNPDNKVIHQALAKKYEDFYTTQIQQRTDYAYPPITDIATLWCFKKSSTTAMQHAQDVLQQLRTKHTKVTFVGPALAHHTKKVTFATAQIVVKSTQRSLLNAVVNDLPSGWQYDLEPVQLL